MTIRRCAVIAAALALTLGGAGLAEAAPKFEVTITNLTYSQPFSPPLVVSHDQNVAVATPGVEVSPEVVAIAEDGIAAPLLATLEGAPGVIDVQVAPGPIPPGGSQSFTVEASGKNTMITVLGMLVATNDAFFLANGVPIPLRGESRIFADAWDAGSETNSELCAEIPAVPCADGSNPNERNLSNPEGFLHIHRGVHGGGDLDPARHDWRNGVALITIKRAP